MSKLLVVSHGGCATTAFIKFISEYIPTNCPGDSDGLKHTIPSKITEYNPTHIIYIYGDMDKSMRSMFRRRGTGTTIASKREYKLKGVTYSSSLPNNYEDFEKYVKKVVEYNGEPVGCLIHMREWKKVPNVFFIHYEQICKSETIDDYLGIPKGTCSNFKVKPRESQIQQCESREYLETLKVLDFRIKGIVNGHNHKTDILIVSFPRSGFNILSNIIANYYSVPYCACRRDIDDAYFAYSENDIAFHRSHDMLLKINKGSYNKFVILYRKDVIEQLDAFFRYQFRKNDYGNKHETGCEELDIPYSDKKPFFTHVLGQYVKWIKKWVNTPTPNSIVIEYSDLMINPQKNLDKLQEHLLGTIDSDLSAKIVKEMNIEYKHSLSPKKYKELSNVLLTLT
jgi:hypothetical protein